MKKKSFFFLFIFYILALFGGFFFFKSRFEDASSSVIEKISKIDPEIKFSIEDNKIFFTYNGDKSKVIIEELFRHNIKINSYSLSQNSFKVSCKPSEEICFKVVRNFNDSKKLINSDSLTVEKEETQEEVVKKKKYQNVSFLFPK